MVSSNDHFGTWSENATNFMSSTGLVIVEDLGGTIEVNNDYTLKNHFIVDNPSGVPLTGKLTFDIATGKTLTINGVVINAPPPSLHNGGAINVNNGGELQFIGGGNLVMSNNSTQGYGSGGAVGMLGTNATTFLLDFSGLASATFRENTAGGNGGAIAGGYNNVSLGNNLTFAQNQSNTDGGAIDTYFRSVTLGNSVYFEGNSAGRDGGAIRAGEVTLGGNSFFLNNTAGRFGGAMFIAARGTGNSLFNADTGDIAFAGNVNGSTSNSLALSHTALTLTGDHDIYFDDPINGTGFYAEGYMENNSLIKNGIGFVQFAGDSVLNTDVSNYDGSTLYGGRVDVNEGTFRVVGGASFTTRGLETSTGAGDGAVFNVGTEGTLAGAGTITAQQGVIIAGTLAPDSWRYAIPGYDLWTNEFGLSYAPPTGNNIGTLTINSDVTFTDSSAYQYNIVRTATSRASDCLDMSTVETSVITIFDGARLDVLVEGGRYLRNGDRFLVIQADNLGQFSDDQLFDLNIIASGTPFDTTLFDHEIGTFGGQAGYWLFYLGKSQIPLPRIYTIFTPVELQRGFQALLPSARERAGVFAAGCDPCAAIDPCDPCGNGNGVSSKWNRWGAIAGDFLERKKHDRVGGYDFRNTGVAVGMDRYVSKNAFAGVAFGYDNAFTRMRDGDYEHDQMDTFRGMLYGGVRNGKTYIDGYAGYTNNGHKVRRDTFIRSKFNDDLVSMGFDLGRKWSNGITPSVGLHYIRVDRPDVVEFGNAPDDLFIYGNVYESLRLPIGAKWNRDYKGRNGIVWKPELRAFYVRECADDQMLAWVAYNDARNDRTLTSSNNLGRNSGRFGAGLGAQLTERLDIRVDYDYELYRHTTASEFGVTVGAKW